MARKQTRRARAASRSDPDTRGRLDALARNLWWTWNADAQRLFEAADPVTWRATHHNPVLTARHLPAHRVEQLDADERFQGRLDDVEGRLETYLDTRPWFPAHAARKDRDLHVAYFCAEYCVHQCMRMYAGGLGVLAGDHLKSASDLGVPLTAIGLIYRHGYYQQRLAADGSTVVGYPHYDFHDWPVTDTGLEIDVPLQRRTVRAKIWEMKVGRVSCYLLDTDIPANKPKDRAITHYLYGGDHEYRIQQEIVLGVGGVIALDKLGIEPTVYHLNEGHAAFCGLERMRRLVADGRTVDQAKEAIRRSTVFTTHTPVPEGNDRFDPKPLSRYLTPLTKQIGLNRTEWLALGREDPGDRDETFCMTVLALRLAEHCNGVAALHGDTSRKMWMKVYAADAPEDVPIGHVTNGVHVQTWLAPEAEPLYRRYLKPRWVAASPEDDWWRKADRIPAEALWAMRNHLRAKLVNFVRERLAEQIARRCEPIDELIAAHETFDEHALTLGFARRFATYKRAPLIFKDARRLAGIMGDADRPVQIVFAGKAHPLDPEGKRFIQRIYRHAKRAGFRGRVVILEDYDMHVGRVLTAGSDVWLNNPLRPMEASGTSGMKPTLHGGINCSILDGWWPEGYNARNGWAIGDPEPQPTRAAQDRHDAEAIYRLLEDEIVPMFYDRNRKGLPTKWLKIAAESMRSVPAAFSTHRMLRDYLEGYYLPAHRG